VGDARGPGAGSVAGRERDARDPRFTERWQPGAVDSHSGGRASIANRCGRRRPYPKPDSDPDAGRFAEPDHGRFPVAVTNRNLGGKRDEHTERHRNFNSEPHSNSRCHGDCHASTRDADAHTNRNAEPDSYTDSASAAAPDTHSRRGLLSSSTFNLGRVDESRDEVVFPRLTYARGLAFATFMLEAAFLVAAHSPAVRSEHPNA
jgi:hypothetical protein